MKLLFIQGGTRLKKDNEGNYYTDGNINNKVWDRYKKMCDELTVVLRVDKKNYTKEYCEKNFNQMNTEKMNVVELEDLMRPKTNFFNVFTRNKTKKAIEKAIQGCDKAIIRSAHNFYTLNAIKSCKKYNKDYLIEVAGYAFDGYWGHGDLYGKIVAIPYEILAKRAMKDAMHCVYVTNISLQKRYPCRNQTLGCSDVELQKLNENDLIDKIKKLEKKKNNNERLVLGTIGWVNLKLKGQRDVIKAIWLLKNQCKIDFEYQLVGLGDHDYLDNLIEKYNLKDCVKILGAKPHDEVFKWLEEIDIYIQPSYQEGLCRAVVEAMSKACPIIVSNAGGNPELANEKFVFKKGNVKELCGILKSIKYDDLIAEAKRSYYEAKNYEKELLDAKRNIFYEGFIKGDLND